MVIVILGAAGYLCVSAIATVVILCSCVVAARTDEAMSESLIQHRLTTVQVVS